jgi:hypothetical protein
MNSSTREHMVLTVSACLLLAMLVCTIPLAYLILGLEYFPAWYRPAAIAELLWFALRTMFGGRAAQFFCMMFLAVAFPLFIGIASRFSERFAESGGNVAAFVVVMAPFATATLLYVSRRGWRTKGREPV